MLFCSVVFIFVWVSLGVLELWFGFLFLICFRKFLSVISSNILLFSSSIFGSLISHMLCVSCSVISNSVTPWTVAYSAPLSMESWQEYWSGLPFPSLTHMLDSLIIISCLLYPVFALFLLVFMPFFPLCVSVWLIFLNPFSRLLDLCHSCQ